MGPKLCRQGQIQNVLWHNPFVKIVEGPGRVQLSAIREFPLVHPTIQSEELEACHRADSLAA
jgi:hypothetical protein